MPGSWVQDSFLGGQWSKFYQGRFKDPKYGTAMNLCLNAIPVEEGAAVRRPGFNYIARTRAGVFAVVREFSFTSSLPYTVEFTPGHIRFAFGNLLVLEPTTQMVTSISSANPAVVTTAAAHGWSTGDEVEFNLPVGATDVGTALLFNRQLSIIVLSASTFAIYDNVTQAPVPGNLITLGPEGTLVSRVLDFATPYTAADIASLDIRLVQGNNQGTEVALVLCPDQPPQVLTAASNPDPLLNAYATFTFGPWTPIDGPYLDPVNDGGVITSSGLGTNGAVVTLTLAYQSWSSTVTYGIGASTLFSGIGYISLIDSNLNLEPDTNSQAWLAVSPGNSVGVNGFVSTDVGRQIRLFSEPPNWVSTTAYAVNAVVDYGGQYWIALLASTDVQPGIDVTHWAIDTTAAAWTWGRIQSIVSATSVTVQLLGGALLYFGSSNPISLWQMGRYSNTTGWPSGGLYFEGRLWTWSTNFPNHFDGSSTDNLFQFTPSDPDGTVTDADGISELLNSKESNPILWGLPAFGGFILGTQEGEWLVQATSAGEPLTATSIQAHMNTRYGQAPVEPAPAGLSFIMVQRFARKVLELILDVFTQKSVATNISVEARDLVTSGVVQVAYQRERTPILWVAQNSGQLVGTTYRRDSPYGTTPAAFNAWHQHQHGANRQFVGLIVGASPGGEIDAVTCVTWDGINTNGYSLEVSTDIFDIGAPLTSACFLDYSAKPLAVVVATVGGVQGVILYGYYYLAGQTVQVWGAGLDLGDYTVSATGTIFVPFGADATYAGFFGPGTFGAYSPGLFTAAYLAELPLSSNNFNGLGVFVNNGNPAGTTGGEPNVGAIGEFFINTYNYSTGGNANGGVDWENNLLYVAGFTGMTNGISVYNIQSQEPYAAASQTTIMGGTGADQQINTGPVGQDGFMYYYCSSQNSGPYAKVNSALTLVGKWGAGSGTGNSGTGGMAGPRSNCAVFAGYQYIVQCALLSGGALTGGTGTELAVFDGTHMAFTSAYGADQANGTICAGRQTNDGLGHYYGEAYCLVNNYTVYLEAAELDANFNQPMSLWRIAINESPPSKPIVTYTNLGSITPEAVDPLWHWWSYEVTGIVYDQADGNVITVVQTGAAAITYAAGADFILHQVVLGSNSHAYVCTTASGSGSSDPTTDAGAHWTDKGVPAFVHSYYVIKVNPNTMTILWAIPVAGNTVDPQWGRSSQVNGHLALHDSATTVQWIDTIAGTTTVLTIANVTPQGQQFYGPGGLITAVNYFDSGSPPTPVAAAPCTTSFTNHWGYFQAVPSVATPTYSPFVVGYTYPTKGQVLRVIDPQASGTPTGPSMGKTRKIAECAWLLKDASGVSFGVDFDLMRPAELKWNGVKGDPQAVLPMPANQTYDNIVWDKVDSDWNFDSMPCWQVTRPYPCTVVAVEGFQQTSER